MIENRKIKSSFRDPSGFLFVNEGRKFVIENFSWENSTKKFIQDMKEGIN